MNFPDADICLQHILKEFRPLIDKYGYEFQNAESKKFNSKAIYDNKNLNIKIEIENHTDYTNYGFSIFVYSTDESYKDVYTTAIIIPFDKQDKKCVFIKNAANEFLSKIEEYCSMEKYGVKTIKK